MPIDYSKYPKDWKLRSRFVRFYRAKNKCEWCGVENGQLGQRDRNGKWHTEDAIHSMNSTDGSCLFPKGFPKMTRIVLTVAHVYDMDKRNASLLNLAALCQRCHLNHDRDHHMKNAAETRKRKAGLIDMFNDEPAA